MFSVIEALKFLLMSSMDYVLTERFVKFQFKSILGSRDKVDANVTIQVYRHLGIMTMQ